MKGYRTILFNLAALVVAIASLPEVAALIPPEYMPQFMLSVAVGNMILRTVTTTPVGRAT